VRVVVVRVVMDKMQLPLGFLVQLIQAVVVAVAEEILALLAAQAAPASSF
jgi:hypothetical protein